ncbi:MAG: PIG-L deacetylase family protein [Gemmatimonadaceae bacterium]
MCVATFDGANVVVVAPHPDDESLATGGLIQTVLARGANVSVILLTDGDRNPWPQRVIERRLRIDTDARARWGSRRRAEAKRALAILGVNASAIHFLGWPDMFLTARLMSGAWEATRELAGLFTRLFPATPASSLLVIPALSDRHPDHSAAHVLVELALAQAELAPHTLGYVVHGRAHSPATGLRVQGRSRLQKLAAVEQHSTQLVLSRRRMRKYAERPERFTLERRSPGTDLVSRHVLFWDAGAISLRLSRLLVASNSGAWALALSESEQSISTNPAASDQLTVVRRGRVLTLELPASLRTAGPIYVKLATTIDSPWIYDRWGWQRLDASR